MCPPSPAGCASVSCVALLSFFVQSALLNGYPGEPPDKGTADAVVARLSEHFGDGPRPIVLAVGADQFPPAVWNRVKHLVAFRIHRRLADGTTRVDAAVYLVRDSDLYFKAAAALRNRTMQNEYVWCLLAAVVAHESAHTAPMTERQALEAEIAQLRRCRLAGHLYASDDWNPVVYLGQVEAKLRHPHEHY